MGWWVYLEDDRGHEEGSWNYTSNCNGMVNALVDRERRRQATIAHWRADGHDRFADRMEADPEREGSWCDVLNGMSCPEGAELLHEITIGLEADPERFRAMNPENGWGDYDSLLVELHKMIKAVPEWPTTWHVSR